MLTEEMFMKQIHKGYHFVQFTIPSNKVCKLMASDWEKLTETYKNKDKVTVSQVSIVWASSRENLSSGVCEQQRRRPACASAQSDQRLCY